MSSFFTSSDKIKVGQTDVAVPSENGLDYRPGGKIDLYIPPTSKFVDLSQSRLKFDVTLSIPAITGSDGAMRVQLRQSVLLLRVRPIMTPLVVELLERRKLFRAIVFLILILIKHRGISLLHSLLVRRQTYRLLRANSISILDCLEMSRFFPLF